MQLNVMHPFLPISSVFISNIILIALHNRSLGICFFLYKNLSYWSNDIFGSKLYTLTQDMSHASPVREPAGSYIVTDVCTHNRVNINKCEHITEKAH